MYLHVLIIKENKNYQRNVRFVLKLLIMVVDKTNLQRCIHIDMD